MILWNTLHIFHILQVDCLVYCRNQRKNDAKNSLTPEVPKNMKSER